MKIEVFFSPSQIDDLFLRDKNVVVIDVLRASTSVITATTGMPAGTFCANCHSETMANSRMGTNHTNRGAHRIACMNCHARIQHGGPRPGMLVAPAGAAAGVGNTIDGWDINSPYAAIPGSQFGIASYPANNTTNWGQSNCGCGDATPH